MLGRTLEALLVGVALTLGAYLAHELRDPCSTVRLKAAEAVDRLREVRGT